MFYEKLKFVKIFWFFLYTKQTVQTITKNTVILYTTCKHLMRVPGALVTFYFLLLFKLVCLISKLLYNLKEVEFQNPFFFNLDFKKIRRGEGVWSPPIPPTPIYFFQFIVIIIYIATLDNFILVFISLSMIGNSDSKSVPTP